MNQSIIDMLESKIHPKGIELFAEHNDRLNSGEDEMDCLNCGLPAASLALKIFSQYDFVLYGLCDECISEFKNSNEEEIEIWFKKNSDRTISINVKDYLN